MLSVYRRKNSLGRGNVFFEDYVFTLDMSIQFLINSSYGSKTCFNSGFLLNPYKAKRPIGASLVITVLNTKTAKRNRFLYLSVINQHYCSKPVIIKISSNKV